MCFRDLRNKEERVKKGEERVTVRPSSRQDVMITKPPGQPASPDGAGAGYHQDAPEHGSDRVGELQFWLALVEITPDMGPPVEEGYAVILSTAVNIFLSIMSLIGTPYTNQ